MPFGLPRFPPSCCTSHAPFPNLPLRRTPSMIRNGPPVTTTSQGPDPDPGSQPNHPLSVSGFSPPADPLSPFFSDMCLTGVLNLSLGTVTSDSMALRMPERLSFHKLFATVLRPQIAISADWDSCTLLTSASPFSLAALFWKCWNLQKQT